MSSLHTPAHAPAHAPAPDSALPQTVILVHPRERRSKCSVEPLRTSPDYLFVRWPDPVPISLAGYVRLGIGGPILSEADRHCGLLLLDGTWRLAANMVPHYLHLPVRSLPPILTAYPRRSRLFDDPAEGLSTIEALYAALRILGRNTTGLLDHYHWKAEFLQKNGWSEDR